ncbi:MAG: twin-arginine translocase subunit TatB [Rhizobiales bacterium]|nr:twin-arginine translocase subunit TatB [Hyphomicrobiales bacterium]
MFEVGWTEMLVIAIVMIVVVGPKDLPRMLRTFGKATSKMRSMAGEFRKQFDEALKEAELEDVKTLASDMRKLNPAADIRKALNPMEKAAADLKAGVDAAMKPTAKPDESATPAAATPVPAEPLKAGPDAMPGETAAAVAATAPATNGAAAPKAAKPAAAKATAAPKTAKPAAAAPKTAAAAKPAPARKATAAAAKPAKAASAKTSKTGGKA